MRDHRILAIAFASMLAGCASDDGQAAEPSSLEDSSHVEVTADDTALTVDTAIDDTGAATDSTTIDAPGETSADTMLDSEPADSAAAETGPSDDTSLDVLDTSTVDTAVIDTSSDTSPADTEVPDTTPVDTSPPDTDPGDTGLVDTGSVDTEVPDTAPIDTGPIDTGPPTWGSICGTAGAPRLVGQIVAPNGTDPVPFSFAYVPISIAPMPATVTCETCMNAIDPPYAAARTDVDGRFSLDLTDVPTSAPLRLVVRKGRFRKVTTFAATCGATITVTKSATTLPGASAVGNDLPKIAVGSGNADHLDNVVVSMGISQFDCYEGRTSTGANCPTAQRTGKKVLDLLKDPPTLSTYSLLFISCAPGIWNSYSSADRSTIVTNLGAWVAKGGRLIVTDHSYDYVSQTWPNEIIWHGPPRAAGVWPIGTLGGAGANVGIAPTTGTTFPGVINDTILTSWLKLPEIGVTSAPNVALTGWLAPWTVQQSLPSTTVQVVHGNVQYDYPKGGATETADLPLTSKFVVAGCGRVIYSSYHTSSGSTTSLSNQERILEYLMLESAGCVGTD